MASSERLRNFYRIEQVDPELVRELATRLSSDKQASVSPILQIWMTELWKDAQESSVDARSLTFKGFRELKLEELSIRNFLYQQLQKLRPPANEHLASGLVHDFLSFHVSTRGDSQVASASQKEEFYIDPERRTADIVRDLESELRRVGILMEPTGRGVLRGDTRIMHDTLIPEVRKLFEESNLPGQKARRIIENRATEWHGDEEGPCLDEHDLGVVEAGRWAMRNWSADETRLVGASRRLKRRKAKLRSGFRLAAGLAFATIFLFGGLFLWQWTTASQERARAKINNLVSRIENIDLREVNLRLLVAAELAIQDEGTNGLGLLLTEIEKSKSIYSAFRLNSNISSMATNRNKGLFALSTEDGTLSVWRLRMEDEPHFELVSSRKEESAINCLAFDLTGNYLASCSGSSFDQAVRLWKIGTPTEEIHDLERPSARFWFGVSELAFSPDGKYLVGTGSDMAMAWSTLTGEVLDEKQNYVVVSVWQRDWRLRQFFSSGGFFCGNGPLLVKNGHERKLTTS